MSLISCAQMVGNPRIASDPAAAPATAAAPFNSVRRLSFLVDLTSALASVPVETEVDVRLSLSSMATLVGYDEGSHRSTLTGCGMINCPRGYWRDFAK